MRACVAVVCWLLCSGSVLACAQSGSGKPAVPTANSGSETKSVGNSPAELEREFFAIVRSGDTLKFLSYVPEDGVNLGRDAKHSTRAEIEDQLTNRRGLYCRIFDSSCI